MAFPGSPLNALVFSDMFRFVWLELAGPRAPGKLRLFAGVQLCPRLFAQPPAVRPRSCAAWVGRPQWGPRMDSQRALSSAPCPADEQPSASLNSDLCLPGSGRPPVLVGCFPCSGGRKRPQSRRAHPARSRTLGSTAAPPVAWLQLLCGWSSAPLADGVGEAGLLCCAVVRRVRRAALTPGSLEP